MRITGDIPMCLKHEKGIIFSFDLGFAFIALCIMMYLILLNADAMMEAGNSRVSEFGSYSRSLLIADSAVKNYDMENPLLGSAHYSLGKRRVEENVIDAALLAKVDGADIVFLEYGDDSREMIRDEEKGKECIVAERFVFLGGRKAKLDIGFCSG